MERKKLIISALLILGVIIALILVENSIRGIGNLVKEKKEQKEEEENRKKYEASEEYKEEQMLTGIVADFSDLLKTKDIDTLYSMIDENYKDFRYQNQKELFEQDIKQYMQDDTELKLQTYEMMNGKYYCSILSESAEGISSFKALLNPSKTDNSYTIILGNITNIEKKDLKYKDYLNIECDMKYKVTAEKTCIYSIEFTNLNENDIDYTIDRISVTNTKKGGFNAILEDKKMTLKSGEKVTKNIVFNASGIHRFPHTNLKIYLKDSKGEIKTLEMYIDSSM